MIMVIRISTTIITVYAANKNCTIKKLNENHTKVKLITKVVK